MSKLLLLVLLVAVMFVIVDSQFFGSPYGGGFGGYGYGRRFRPYGYGPYGGMGGMYGPYGGMGGGPFFG
uniref:Uncharacterized protein n=1 Tax=Panagrolaimus davidi TaxID=227884 RepID=A0A914P4T8_9BILA